MRSLGLQVLRGPNLHRAGSVVCLTLDTEGVAPVAVETLRARADLRLPVASEWRPAHAALARLGAAGQTVGWAEVVGALAAELQEERFETSFGYRVHGTTPGGATRVLVETDDGAVGHLAAQLAILIAAALAAEDGDAADADLAAAMERFEAGRSQVRFDWNTRVLVDAARDRGVPITKLVPDHNLAVIGQGRWRQRFRGTSTDSDACEAARISKDKHVTARLLGAAFVPVPRQRLIRWRSDLDAAVREIGYPLVVKGRTVDKGSSVTTGVSSEQELAAAVARVRALGDMVMVEQQIEGDDYRLTVVGGRLVAAARRLPARVVGDGVHDVRALVAIENERRSRSGRYARWVEPLRLAAEAETMLARESLTANSVPEAGRSVRLSGPANLSTGGLSEDVTDALCPTLARLAERVARIVGLETTGIDIITPDITRPLDQAGGAVIEVNAEPGLRPHYVTATPRDVAGAIIDHLFPPPRRGRIPTVGVTGTNGKTTTCRMIAHILEQAGLVVGSATTSGLTVAGAPLAAGDLAGGGPATVVLHDPLVEAGVFELARGGIIRHGLGVDDVDVGIVTNLTVDHLGQDGIDQVEQLIPVKRLVVEVARQAAVLNADDGHCRRMAAGLRAPVWWVARSAGHPVVAAHLERGGDAVVLETRDDHLQIVHRRGKRCEPILPVASIPATLGGIAIHNVENAQFAAAAGLALDLPGHAIRSGLASFDNSFAMSPCRLNIHDVDGIRFVLDFVHNADGMQKIGRTLAAMPCSGRRILLYLAMRPTGGTDVLDELYQCVTAAAAPYFDLFILTERDDPAAPGRPRNRPPGQATRLGFEGLRGAGVAADRISMIEGVERAVDQTIELARPGDLVLLSERASPAETWRKIQAYRLAEPTVQPALMSAG